MEMVHPSRSDWSEELYAKAMSSGMKAYETEVFYAIISFLPFFSFPILCTLKEIFFLSAFIPFTQFYQFMVLFARAA